MVRKIKKIAASILFICIHLMKAIVLIPGGSCRFIPTCSVYAKEAIESLPFHKAAMLIIGRIIRCHPFAAGGYDPLPNDCAKAKG